MFDHLQIYDARERIAVGVADTALRGVAAIASLGRREVPPTIRRILLLRIERIGDLLMTLGPIGAVRDAFPGAEIDLVVGSWNASIASVIPGVDRVETIDAPWLARGGAGATWAAMLAQARGWRARRYDLAINFEGDIRSHALMARSGAPLRIGFDHAGGGPLLTHVVPFDPSRHTSANAQALVECAVRAAPAAPMVTPPGDVPAPQRLHLAAMHTEAARLRLEHEGWRGERLVAMHASGGRAVKQWHPDRFGSAISMIAADHGATIVLTGAPGDRALVDAARAAIDPDRTVIDLTGDVDLLTLAAVLARCEVYLTGDTGPMHLAAAVGTPIVAVFGPSMPWRYGPLAPHVRVVRIDLPCAPCNQIRLPPERCRRHVPDCLDGIGVQLVVNAARDLARDVTAARTGEEPPR